MLESSKAVGPWRERVALAAADAMAGAPMIARGVAMAMAITFVMPRPASTPKTRTPPAVKRPDLDKLTRAVLDAMTNVTFPDDSAVVSLRVGKRLADRDEQPGAAIEVTEICGG